MTKTKKTLLDLSVMFFFFLAGIGAYRTIYDCMFYFLMD